MIEFLNSDFEVEMEVGKRVETHCIALWFVTEKQLNHFWKQQQSFTTETTKHETFETTSFDETFDVKKATKQETSVLMKRMT